VDLNGYNGGFLYLWTVVSVELPVDFNLFYGLAFSQESDTIINERNHAKDAKEERGGEYVEYMQPKKVLVVVQCDHIVGTVLSCRLL
jgi:hypothetical protein